MNSKTKNMNENPFVLLERHMHSPLFNPTDHYWKSGDGRIFSSKKGRLVAADDIEFEGWCTPDKQPTVWPRDDAGEQTNAALYEVLKLYGLSIDGYTPGSATADDAAG